LQLDINKIEKILSYIPTKSSVDIMQRYLYNVARDTQEKSTLLIGPYGKGKSHLILVLLMILSLDYSEENENYINQVMQKIQKISVETADYIRELRENKKRYLPVVVSNSQMDLNQAYLVALNEALKKYQLTEIIPDTFYTEAIKVIANWEEHFATAYEMFGQILKQKSIKISELVLELKQCKKDALDTFSEIYPLITAGSTFNPMINMDIISLYQQVNDAICENYGFSGMFIVFDEFSKFIEGHNQDTIASDMKILQDICELANGSKNRQIHTLFVAHKSIKQYNNVLSKDIINAFTGVEGRLKEILFISSSQNNYELIQNAIHKTEIFETTYRNSEGLKNIFDETYSLPAFNTLFDAEDFRRIVVEGCFPLSPVSAYLLLGISEKVAQNERTLFTFISKDEPYSMARFIKEHNKHELGFIYTDCIYDYFKGIFKTDVANTFIHTEWLKADYALKQVKNSNDEIVIKTLLILNVMNRQDEMPPIMRYIELASGLIKSDLNESLNRLKKLGLIDYRNSTEQYYFKKMIGVDLEKEIRRKKNGMVNTNWLEVLSSITEFNYIMPKVHNQKFCIKRYFDYRFIRYEELMNASSSDLWFEERRADGKVLLILSDKSLDSEQCKKIIDGLGDERVVGLVSNRKFAKAERLLDLQAVRLLMKDQKFTEEHEIVIEELMLLEEELIFEINEEIKSLFDFKKNSIRVLYNIEEQKLKISSEKEFNRFISNICDQVYSKTPIINNEMINKNEISSQIKSARKSLVEKILGRQDLSGLYTGTAPEASIFRATLIFSGIGTEEVYINEGLNEILNEIRDFIFSCEENKRTLKELYDILMKAPYGMRRGSIPIFIAYSLRKYECMPIIYLGSREVCVNSEVINSLNDKPEDYSLFIVKGTVERIEYLNKIKELFVKYEKVSDNEESIIAHNVVLMQRWMQSLPNISANYKKSGICDDLSDEEFVCLEIMRKILKKIECNARELLFEKIPSKFENDDYTILFEHIKKMKDTSDQYIDRIKDDVIKQVKKLFLINTSDSLSVGLQAWYKKQSETAKTVLVNTKMNGFMDYVSSFDTHDEHEIINKISKIILDIHIENWNNNSANEFMDNIAQLKKDIEQTEDQDIKSKSKITLSRGENEIVRYYDTDSDDSMSYFLKNELTSVLDEFGESLEINQKVSVLAQLINELIS